ncbi:hypothetical protein AB3Y40_14130 [Yoonia sp. R2331]|uniref:hypothetical protein n=1 Tax=Yoonia sp. R2331 TaxID=3237238 RepID=UPI0034E53E56
MAYLATHTLEEMNRGWSFAGLRATLSRALLAMQVARMESVLSQMSAVELERIGITYADIPAYARKMVSAD